MYRPMLELPDFKAYKGKSRLSCVLAKLTRMYSLAKASTLTPSDVMLVQYLSELLAFFVAQHGHRAQFFILSNPVSMRIASLLYMKQKPLRHGESPDFAPNEASLIPLPPASLRYLKACLKASNHFIHRHLIKYEMLLPMLELLESESPRDNMLSSACLDIFEVIRKVRLYA